MSFLAVYSQLTLTSQYLIILQPASTWKAWPVGVKCPSAVHLVSQCKDLRHRAESISA